MMDNLVRRLSVEGLDSDRAPERVLCRSDLTIVGGEGVVIRDNVREYDERR